MQRQALERELAACRAELRAVLGGLFMPSKEAADILSRKKKEYKAKYSDDSHWKKFPSKNDVEWKLYDRDERVVVSITVTKNGVIVWVNGSSNLIPVSSAQIGAWMQRVKPIARAPDCREYSISTLCANMHRDGYRWATLTRSTRLDVTEIDPAKGLGSGVKPDNVLYFSELVQGEGGAYLPYWYRFLDY